MKRRQLLCGFSAFTLTSGAWPLAALAQSNLMVAGLTDRIALVRGAGCNVVLFRGDPNITVIDSGTDADAPTLVEVIRRWADGAPVTTLFNTHWHDDHTGGNEELRALGADIIAHENTRLWLTAEFDVEWRHTSHQPRAAAALPTETFYTSGEKDLGGETVQYLHYERAHTDGDIALYFPASNVLVAGGLMSDGSYPLTDIASGGWIGGLIEANAAMLEMIDDNTIIIPQSGPVKAKADLQAQHAMLSDLYEKMKALMQQGYSGHDMLEEGVTAAYDATWGDPTEFVLETYRGMWAHTYDMGGFI